MWLKEGTTASKRYDFERGLRGDRSDLEDIRSLDEAHERQEAAVRPAVNSNTTQVHKVKLLSHVLQALHLVLDLHLALKQYRTTLAIQIKKKAS